MSIKNLLTESFLGSIHKTVKKDDHVHKYERVKLGANYFVYRCINCPHYIREDLVTGREATCWRCGETFTVYKNADGSIHKRPHCRACKRKKS